MSLVVVVLLAALWLAILLPGALRGRQGRSPISSVDSFERSMGILAAEHRSRLAHKGSRTPPGRYVLVLDDAERLSGQPRPPRAARRRRVILSRLAVAVAVTGLLTATVGGVFAALFWLALSVSAAYLVLLLYTRARLRGTRATVRSLPARRRPEAAANDLRRQVVSNAS